MPQARVSFFLPHPSLRGFISTYYLVEPPMDAAAIKDLLHPEWGNIRLALSGVWRLGDKDSDALSPPDLYGPTSRAVPISGMAGAGWGIGLLPAGWAAYIGTPASSISDRVKPLASILGESATAEVAAIRTCADHKARAAALDEFFFQRLPTDVEAVNLVQRAHSALMRPETATVEELA